MKIDSKATDALLAARLGRRELLVGAGALAAAASVAVGAEHGDHTGHDHGDGHKHGDGQKHGDAAEHKYFKAERYGKRAALVTATENCVSKGRQCLSHCFETFLAGDTTMAECAYAVDQMLAVCAAMAHLAANDSPQLAEMARACIAVCEHCEKECRRHEEHQPECRACADACAALITEAKKITA